MEFVQPTARQLELGLRALATVARADSDTIAPGERDMLTAARTILGGALGLDPGAFDPDALEPIEPAALASAIVDPRVRYQLVGAMVIMTFADGSIARPEVDMVSRFAAALEVEDASFTNLRRIAEGRLLIARLDILRRQWAAKKIRDLAAEGGVAVYWRSVLGLLRIHDDPEVAGRYRALGNLPEGTLGKAYFDFIKRNEFSFPGEKGAPPEVIVFHDMTHVLSGYDTTPEEEILAAAFSAGYSTYEVYNWFMFVLSQFQLGIPTAPGVPPVPRSFNPARTLIAVRRGAAMNIDLNKDWDYWDDVERPLAEVRARFNIQPEPTV